MFLFFLGLGGFEPPTLRLSGVYSNQLSYKPWYNFNAMRILYHWSERIRTFDFLYQKQMPYRLATLHPTAGLFTTLLYLVSDGFGLLDVPSKVGLTNLL